MWTIVLPVFGAGAGWWLALCAFESLELGRIVFALVLAGTGALLGGIGAYAVLRRVGETKRRAAAVAMIGGVVGLLAAPLVGDALRG